MQQINLRQLRRDVKHGADGRLIFPGMTEITDGVITSGGKLTYVDNGVDVQSQIDSVVASVAAIDIHAHVQDKLIPSELIRIHKTVQSHCLIKRSAPRSPQNSQTQPPRLFLFV